MDGKTVDCTRCGFIFPQRNYRELRSSCFQCSWDTDTIAPTTIMMGSTPIEIGSAWRDSNGVMYIYNGKRWVEEYTFKRNFAAEYVGITKGPEKDVPEEKLNDWELRIQRMLEDDE